MITKMFVYLFLPPFLMMAYVIDKNFFPTIICRFQNRTAAVRRQLFLQAAFALLYLVVYIIPRVWWGINRGQDIPFGEIVRVYMGLILFIEMSVILRKSPVRALSSSAYLLCYLWVLIELLVFPMIGRNLPIDLNIYIIFSWIFIDRVIAYFIMAMLIAAGTFTIWKMNEKEDIWR